MNVAKELLKYLLLEKIHESDFKRVEITRYEDNAVGVKLEGQPFGVIGGLIAAVRAVAESGHMSTDAVIEMIQLGVDFTEQRETTKLVGDDEAPEIFKMFENYIKNDLTEEGEE